MLLNKKVAMNYVLEIENGRELLFESAIIVWCICIIYLFINIDIQIYRKQCRDIAAILWEDFVAVWHFY